MAQSVISVCYRNMTELCVLEQLINPAIDEQPKTLDLNYIYY